MKAAAAVSGHALLVRRIFRSIAIPAVLLTLLLLLGMTLLGARALYRQDEQHLHSLMRLMAIQAEAALVFEDQAGAQELLETLGESGMLGRAELYLASGSLLASYEVKGGEGQAVGLDWLMPHLRLEREIHVDGRAFGTLVLEGRCNHSRKSLLLLLQGLALLALTGLALALALAARWARAIAAPLQDMRLEADGRLVLPSSAWPELKAVGHRHEAALAELERCRHEQQEVDALLEHLAARDPVTGLPDGAAFERRRLAAIREARRSKSRLGMLYLELEHFQSLDLQLGPEASEQVLREAASRLQDWLPAGALAARRMAGQFVVLLPDPLPPEALDESARRLRQALEAPFQLGTQSLSLRVGIGWGVYPDTVDSPDALAHAADAAMYASEMSPDPLDSKP